MFYKNHLDRLKDQFVFCFVMGAIPTILILCNLLHPEWKVVAVICALFHLRVTYLSLKDSKKIMTMEQISEMLKRTKAEALLET